MSYERPSKFQFFVCGYIYDFEHSDWYIIHSLEKTTACLRTVVFNIQNNRGCFDLRQNIFLSDTARSDCVGFTPIVKERYKAAKRNLNISDREYGCIYTLGPPTNWCNCFVRQWQNSFYWILLGIGRNWIVAAKREKAWLAPQISVDYTEKLWLPTKWITYKIVVKPYIPIFYLVIDAALTNAAIVYKTYHPDTAAEGFTQKSGKAPVELPVSSWKVYWTWSKACIIVLNVLNV